MLRGILTFVLFLSFLSAGEFSFKAHGSGYLYKFGGHLKRRSAVAKVFILTEFYRWDNGVSLWGGGSELVWLGRDKGLIQLDPQQADYLLTGGIIKGHSGRFYYLFFDHPCYHAIDTLVTKSLYWNKIRIGTKNRNDFFRVPDSGYFYYAEIGFFIRHPDVWWLTTGHDFQYDFKAGVKKVFVRAGRFNLFADITFYTGISMHYALRPMLEVLAGVNIRGTSGNEGEIVVGYRPIDRKTFREAENVLYAGVRTNF